jgi:hypothetical protein
MPSYALPMRMCPSCGEAMVVYAIRDWSLDGSFIGSVLDVLLTREAASAIRYEPGARGGLS